VKDVDFFAIMDGKYMTETNHLVHNFDTYNNTNKFENCRIEMDGNIFNTLSSLDFISINCTYNLTIAASAMLLWHQDSCKTTGRYDAKADSIFINNTFFGNTNNGI
jgi:hypothetical protein